MVVAGLDCDDEGCLLGVGNSSASRPGKGSLYEGVDLYCCSLFSLNLGLFGCSTLFLDDGNWLNGSLLYDFGVGS